MVSRFLTGGLRQVMVSPEQALTGRGERPYPVPTHHEVLGTPLEGPWPQGIEVIGLALGCFWGAEQALWRLDGVVTTAAGYQGGHTPHPTYEEVCTSLTGHTEVVLVAYDPQVLPTAKLLRTSWEMHDPTQGFRQGNDIGTQYRSAIYWTTPEQRDAATATRDAYAGALSHAGFGAVTTEIRSAEDAGPFFYAEAAHQQYLYKVPNGYCPVHSTGVACPAPDAS